MIPLHDQEKIHFYISVTLKFAGHASSWLQRVWLVLMVSFKEDKGQIRTFAHSFLFVVDVTFTVKRGTYSIHIVHYFYIYLLKNYNA